MSLVCIQEANKRQKCSVHTKPVHSADFEKKKEKDLYLYFVRFNFLDLSNRGLWEDCDIAFKIFW